MANIAARLANDPTGVHAGDDAHALRAGGQPALDMLLADIGPMPTPDQKQRIDEVAQQKDAYASHLYWYTDLEDAKRAAKATGKPILSLRLLGNLTDELSCANSRFFRTALYPNVEVSKALHDGFILHWSMERPAPTITIDFHDGRKIERTITGNSIHYILDADGKPIDAIPGLYSPQAFLRQLSGAQALFYRLASGREDRDAVMRDHHRTALRQDAQRWSDDFRSAQLTAPPYLVPDPSGPPPAVGIFPAAVPANLAMPVAITKMVVERPMVQAVMPPAPIDRAAIDQTPWAKLASVHQGEALVDDASRALIVAKHPMDPSDPSAPKPLANEDVTKMLASFQQAMTEDTEKNELALHARIHAWLLYEPSIDFAKLNARVYDTLFLTPRSDPWLGLVPPSTFTGIENDGVIPR